MMETENKEIYKILDILISEIHAPFYQREARKILVRLIKKEKIKEL
jgi:hypothetical protein